jgi:cell division protein FtsA
VAGGTTADAPPDPGAPCYSLPPALRYLGCTLLLANASDLHGAPRVLMRPNPNRPVSDLIGVLDIGTSKTVCLIVAVPSSHGSGFWRHEGAQVVGFGQRASRGLKAGVVIELDAAEQALRAAVAQAEQMAGAAIEDVILGVTGGQFKSNTFQADTRIENRIVGDADIDRLMAAARRYAQRDGRTLLHLNHIGYRLDGTAGAADPRGMAGSTLAADLHAVTADDAPLRNLLHVVERACLSPAAIVPAAYASGLAATTEEERRLGTTCIDMGAGTTSLSMFAEGQLLSVDAVAVGGQHVTFDIARTLSTPFAEAERIKALYGTLESVESDDRGMVAYTLAGEEEPTLYQTTKAHIRGIVGSRISDLLANVAERIGRSGLSHLAAHRVVLTGGGSQLPGLATFAAEVLGRPVRIARLQPAGMPEGCCGPVFSTALGLAQIALDPAGARAHKRTRTVERGSYLERVGQWLRQGF